MLIIWLALPSSKAFGSGWRLFLCMVHSLVNMQMQQKIRCWLYKYCKRTTLWICSTDIPECKRENHNERSTSSWSRYWFFRVQSRVCSDIGIEIGSISRVSLGNSLFWATSYIFCLYCLSASSTDLCDENSSSLTTSAFGRCNKNKFIHVNTECHLF